MPGATTARLVVCAFEMPMKLFMMPQTVPNRPTKGDVALLTRKRFGTVWGIMNSFIGISKAQTTNLAVVAPGIAEALLATAIGLVAAIPAVIIYNHFARVTKTYLEQVSRASGVAARLLSRDLDRSHGGARLHVAELAGPNGTAGWIRGAVSAPGRHLCPVWENEL